MDARYAIYLEIYVKSMNYRQKVQAIDIWPKLLNFGMSC